MGICTPIKETTVHTGGRKTVIRSTPAPIRSPAEAKERIESQIATLQNWSQKAHRDSTKQGSQSERRQLGFKEYHRVKAKSLTTKSNQN